MGALTHHFKSVYLGLRFWGLVASSNLILQHGSATGPMLHAHDCKTKAGVIDA